MDLPTSRQTKLNWPLWLKIFVGVIVGGYATLYVGVTIFSWSGPRVRRIVHYIPVPIAWVGTHPIWADSVFTQASALETYNAYQQAASLPTTQSGNTIASATTKAIKDVVDSVLMKQYSLTVSAADVDQAFTTEVTQAGATSSIDKTLKDLYGWTPAQFKEHVVRVDLARDRLREKFSFDSTLNKSAQEQAATVRQQISADGKNMAEIATKYSQDAYAANGGLTDFIKRGELVQELDQAAFSLELNAVSDVIHTKYGFHIIQVTERQGEGDAVEVKLRSVFIAAPSIEDAEKKYLNDHRPWVMVRTLRWDTNTALVTER